MKKSYTLETAVIHAGERETSYEGEVTLPIFQSSAYEYNDAQQGDTKYIRRSNLPNHEVLHHKRAALEHAEAALVFSSGMAAITTALLATLKHGDHLLAHQSLYGGTMNFFQKHAASFGISCDFIDATDPTHWKKKIKPNTKAIYIETITNPLMEVPHLKAVVDFAREHNLISMTDNTFATPINFRPAELGFDVSLHSATKYLNGHSDLIAGAAIGKKQYITAMLQTMHYLGAALDPHACFLLHRGLKTLAIRMKQHHQNAKQLAEMLSQHPKVKTVSYPGLTTHPQHHFAREFLDGFSGMLSFEIDGDATHTESFFQKLNLDTKAVSLGGVETLLCCPAKTSHAAMGYEERMKAGVSDTLIRVSVGIESAHDLLEDFKQALA